MSEPINLGIPPNRRYRPHGNRMVKMFRPECRNRFDDDGNLVFTGCQESGDPTWFEWCQHEPYSTTVVQREQRNVLEEMPDGRRKIVGTETVEWEQTLPNLTQVPLSIRINSGRSLESKKAKGWKTAEEMGYLPFCQFVDCNSQDIKHRTAHGDYCTEWQAKVIAADENEDKLEILDGKKRQRQMAQIAV